MEEIWELLEHSFQTVWECINYNVFGEMGGLYIIVDLAIILALGYLIFKGITR